MQRTRRLHTHTRSSQKGFALVVSLSLMSFVLLLILSIATMTRVETRVSQSSLKQLHAEQQAFLGLQLALGELQKSTGPDQRITAPAELLNGTSETRVNVVGVWSSEDQNLNISPEDRLLNWLTSDARDSTGLFNTTYNANDMPAEGSPDAVVLVGTNSLVKPDDNSPIPTGKKIILDTTETQTLGLNGEATGRYAWWIGDEGSKATINRTRDQVLDRERAVLEISSPSIARIDVLDDLTGIDVFQTKEISNITSLNNLALLDGGSNGVGNPYFHDLTTHSTGLMVDVVNGGFKKDLSLAFEMNDDAFNDSEFGAEGDSETEITAPGFGQVQPVFTIGANGAHGPVWHLLRDYYRLYHVIEDPWNNPKLDARVFGPNLNHSNPNLNLELGDFNNASATIDGQPAVAMAGGKAKFKMHAWNKPDGGLISGGDMKDGRNQNPVSNNVIDFAMHPNDPIKQANGDPLNGGGSMPIMVTANYMPYMMRFMGEIGVWFTDEDHPTKEDTVLASLNISSRERLIMHNPYNVTIAHSDIAIDSYGGEFGVRLYDNTNKHVKFQEIVNDNLEDVSDIWVKQTRRCIRMEASELKPGEIITYQADTYGNTTPSEIITDDDVPEWHHYKLQQDAKGNDGWLFEKPTGDNDALTLAIFGSYMNNHLTRSDITNSIKSQLSFTSLFFSTHLRENNAARNDETIQHRWPMASVIDTAFLFPGAEYDGSLNPAPSGLAYFFPEADDADKLFPNYLSNDGPNTLPITNVSLNTYTTREDSEPMLTIDVQLKPAEYGRTSTRYPAFTRSNPLAPVRDSKNLLPLDDFINHTGTESLKGGFPKVSPDLAVEFTDSSTFGFSDTLNAWGPTDGKGGGVTAPVLIELPTSPVLSIGKLQHANLSVHAHMPALAVANSLASVYISPENTFETYLNNYGQERVFYDLSYLMNEALWDSYFFSSLSVPYDETTYYSPANGKVLETFNRAFSENATTSLPNPRNQLHTLAGESPTSVRTKLFDGTEIKEDAYQRVAENLVCDGSFNVNSTSVNAWRTILSGARDLAIYQAGQNTPTSIPGGATAFPRHSRPTDGNWDGGSASDTEAWKGFRSLSDSEILTLANSIVAELKARSRAKKQPYLSLGDFVNRELEALNEDLNADRCGLLQAAINRAELNKSFLDNSISQIESNSLNASLTGQFKAPDNILESGTSNATADMSAPTYLMQADILQAIGSFISVRSDTFKIRSYGDYRDPLTGEVLSSVWFEAIVQRTPEPVIPNASTPAEAEYWNANHANNPFGRRFKIISIRQLQKEEV